MITKKVGIDYLVGQGFYSQAITLDPSDVCDSGKNDLQRGHFSRTHYHDC